MSYGKTESVSLNENIGKIRITENLIVILTFNANSFAIAILVFFFLIFLLVTFSGRTAERFLANVLRLVIKKACYQDLSHSLDTSRNISVKIFPQVVIRDACGAWHGNQHSRNPKKHKKQPENRNQIS